MTYNRFFSADHHFDHENITIFCGRPFKTAKEMNEALIEKHNAVVKPEDHVYILGDFAFTSSSERIAELMSRLNGSKIFVSGNHDNDRLILDANKHSKYKMKLQAIHYRILELHGGSWDGYAPTLSHYPMLSWNRSYHGSFHLHGHTHGNIPFDPNVRRLDVGVDCFKYVPVVWEDIVAKLKDIPTPKERNVKT